MSAGDGRPIRIEEVLRHHDWIHRLACALLGGDHDADDVVQATYLTALEHPPLPSGNLQGWLRRVTTNHVRMRWRREGAFRRLLVQLHLVTVDGRSSDEIVEQVEVETLIADAMLQLPEKYRRVIVLRYYEGLSCVEIARRGGESSDTIRSQVRRGLARIRDELEAATGGAGDYLPALLWPVVSGDYAGLRPGERVARTWAAATLVAATLALLVGALLNWSPDQQRAQPPGPDADASARNASARNAEQESATSSPRRRGASHASAEGSRTDGEAAAEGAAPDLLGDTARELRIRGTLPDPGPREDGSAPPWSLSITAIVSGQAPSKAATAHIDVPPGAFASTVLFDRGISDSSELSELWISADHPYYLPLDWSVPVAPGMGGPIRIDHMPRPVVASVVVGTVTGADGRPSGGAVVALFEIEARHSTPVRSEETRTDDLGRFRIRATPESESVLVAFTDERKGKGKSSTIASTKILLPRRGAAAQIRCDLQLIAGVPLRGTLSGLSAIARRAAIPDAEWTRSQAIVATLRVEHGETFALSSVGGLWITGSAAWFAERRADVSDDGTFAFVRDARRSAKITLRGEHLLPGVFTRTTIDAHSLRSDVVVEIDARPVEIEVLDGDVPISGAGCLVSSPSGGGVGALCDERGRARVFAPPGAQVQVSAGHAGYAQQTIDVDLASVEPGEIIRVRLLHAAPTRTWWITLGPTIAPRAHMIGVALFDVERSIPVPSKTLLGVIDGDRYRVDGIPPGRYVASLRSGAPWVEGRSAFADVVIPIDAREADPPSAEIALTRGGRLIVGALGEDGEFIAAPCRVIRSDGSETHARFIGGRPGESRSPSTVLGDLGPAQIDRVLHPGVYQVRVEAHGYVPAEKSVTITEGSLETVILHMRRP